MPTPFKLDVIDFSGGLDLTNEPDLIADNAASLQRNLWNDGRYLRRRGGYRKDPASPVPTAGVYGIGFFDDGSNIVRIAGTQANAYYYQGGFWSLITKSGGWVANTRPWFFRQYKNVLYAFRDGDDYVYASKSLAQFLRAGLFAPTGAPTIGAGAAGVIPAGNYYGVYTYYDSTTGYESDPSPVSAVWAAGGATQCAWSNLVVGSDARMNARRFYRTLVNQTGVYYYVGSDANVGTTFTENTLESAFGDAASYRNARPPGSPVCMELYKERLWVSDGRSLYYSETGLPESMPAANTLEIAPDDGHEIVALLATPDRLWIFKRNSIWSVLGSDPTDFEVRLVSPRHGCSAPHTVRWIDGVVYWYGEGDVWASDGSDPVSMGRARVRPLLEAIDPAGNEFMVAACYPPRNLYIIALAYTADAYLCLALDYSAKAWTRLSWMTTSIGDGGDNVPTCFGDFVDEDGLPRLLAGFTADAGIYDLGYNGDEDDEGSGVTWAVEWEMQTKRYGLSGAEGKMVSIRRLHLNIDNPAGDTADVTLTTDKGTHTRVGIALDQSPRLWRPIALSSSNDVTSTAQILIGPANSRKNFVIRGLAIEGAAYRRHGKVI